MPSERQRLEGAIAALEAQRALLGDAVVDASLAALRASIAALEAAPAGGSELPAQTLRQVTVLFLDVVGSTSLSRRLDPDEFGAVISGALARGTAIVQAHGGKVLQYAGDNILAAFGADEAREDDPERAVRCGLALLELGRALGAEVRAAHDHAGFDVRVGIHTGGVLLGSGASAGGAIRGIAVNIAAQMEQTAPTGALHITRDTHAQVRGLFEVEALAPLAVKGVDEPIHSYLVLRAKPRNFRIGTRGIEGVVTRMIGRNAELQALREAFARLFVQRRLAAVTVVADAGLGKSRLLHEFEAWSEARPEAFTLFRGRATPQTPRQPFGLLRDILARRFQIADDDTVEAARAKMEQGVIPLFEADDGTDLAEGHAHLMGHLIGIEWRASRHLRGILDDPRQIRNRAFHAAAQVFRRASAGDGSPVVLQIEDLHWADNESLDFLDYVAEVDRDVPMLILGFARPLLFERRSDWGSADGVHQRITLSPLDKQASRELTDELLKKLAEVPAVLSELITGAAEGNPFYMEELVKMLIDRGAIGTAGERWSLHADKLLNTTVPATLTGVLQARLDGLPAAEKLALQQASVIGTVFWDQALIALDPKAGPALPALVSRGLVLPRADAPLDGLREYAFQHQLLHQVTYDTVLKRTKRDLHAKVAQWLSGLKGLRARDFLGVIAEHYERAGDRTNAAEFHARAAEHACERLGHDAVLAHVGQALALLDEPGDLQLRWRLLSAREQALELQARRAEQSADIEALEQLADAMDDGPRRAYAAWRRSYEAMRRADWPACESAARRAITLAERAGDPVVRLHALRQVALARMHLGHIEAGQALALQGQAEARHLGLRMNEQFMLNALTVAADLRRDVVAFVDLGLQALQISRDLGDRRAEAIGMMNLGAGRGSLGDLAQARRDMDEALRMLRANGDRLMEGNTLIALSEIALWQGEDSRALSLARSARDIMVAARAPDREAVALLRLGEAELAHGRHTEARRAFERARTLALEIEDTLQHDAAAGLARVALTVGDPSAAMHEVEAVLTALANGGTLEGTETPRLIELTFHRVLAHVGDPRAAAWLARAHDALQAQAAAVSDASLRQAFLNNIPHHRAIMAAWAAREGNRR